MTPDFKNKETLKKEQEELKKRETEKKLPEEAAEIAEKIEAVEIPSGAPEVTEKVSAKKEAGISPAIRAAKAKRVRAHLLKNLPPEKEMRKQVAKAVKKEIRTLERQKNRIIGNPANRDFFKLNIVVQKLRELKHVLESLAQATYEMLKNLWLRFVHGIY